MIGRINILISLAVLFFLLSCSKDEIVNYPIEFDLYGKWLVTDYYSTNGPICYDILLGDTVFFERISGSEYNIAITYELFEKIYCDTFQITETENIITGVGNYFHPDTNEIGPIYDNKLKQYIEITKLDYNKIDFSMKIETFDIKTQELITGDVSHFIARKIR